MIFEKLYTLLTQIESCPNFQSITSLLSNPHDVYPLIPDHFLIDNAIAENDLREISESSRPISPNSKNIPAFLATLEQRIFTTIAAKKRKT